MNVNEVAPKRYFLKKSEKLCSKKIIDKLFLENNSFFSFPFKVVFLFEEHKYVHKPQLLVSVPKKKFSKAHDRNRLKRLIKEAYRKSKFSLADFETSHLKIALLYTHKETLTYQEVEKKLLSVINKINTIQKTI